MWYLLWLPIVFVVIVVVVAVYFLVKTLPRDSSPADILPLTPPRGDALFGTMDSWLMWKLTGGKKHITDVTNASRTLLMSLQGLHWDQSILRELG